MKLSKFANIRIYLLNNEFNSLNRAFMDFVADINLVFGSSVIVDSSKDADIVVQIDKSFRYIEEFQYQISEDKIVLSGQNDLGTIYALYSFLEDELNIPPFYKIEGLKLKRIDEITIEPKIVRNHPKTKYRGWFINDEDLLTNFKYEGHRDIDYPFYRNVINGEMMDLIAETALRYKMNLIIPSTLVDIESPFEENLLKVCSERGLYISQHHIEPLGVSKYGFEKYCKANGLDEHFSYVSNKESLLKCWKHYVERWSKYQRVIWQVGLRGGQDKPVWATDKNAPKTSKERGELIANAIKDQISIVKSLYKEECIFTSTLWMEGAELLNNKDLVLPDDVSIIFSDIGMSQLLGEDFFNVAREENKNYGIYYHAAYWHTGPHLAEGVKPEKMVDVYNLLRETKTNYYSMLNVANIKELTFSLFINSKVLWNDTLRIDEIYDSYTSLYLKDNMPLINAIKDYYNSLVNIGKNHYEYFCKKYNFSYKNYDDSNAGITLNDGMLRSIVFTPFDEKKLYLTDTVLEAGQLAAKNMPKVAKEFEEISKKLPQEYVDGFRSHWVLETLYLGYMAKAALHIYAGYKANLEHDYSTFKNEYLLACDEYQKILNIKPEFFKGFYKGWQDGESKIGVDYLIKILHEEIEKYGI